MNEQNRYARSFGEQCTPRALVTGALGAVVITASSMYVALRMGALPWPTIFVAILSLTVLKALGRTNLNEINVTHTAMSAGGMVAGGLAFTLPGLWMLDANATVDTLPLLAVTVSGALLGVVFTALIRRHFVEVEQLPFPMGIAASETVLAGDSGGGKAKLLFSTLGATAVFTALRDWLGWIPGAWMSAGLMAKNIFFGVWIAPMAVGIGYIIGPLYTGVWFLGALLAYFGIIPLGLSFGFFESVDAANAFKNSLGIGLMVGTGLGILVKGVLPRAREIYGSLFRAESGGVSRLLLPTLLAFVALLLTFGAKMPAVPSLLTILGVWLTTVMAASITGQTGIDPMEIFGIIVLLAIRLVVPLGMHEAFFVAAVVAIASGVAGDVLNDFKAGYLLKTDPRAQMYSELVGAVVGAFVSVAVLMLMVKAFGKMGPGTELPAPQAYAVSTMVGGLPNPTAFFVGLLIGAALYLVNVPGMTLGIGVYLPMAISTTVFLGGLASFLFRRASASAKERGVIVASGMLGGEGVTGVLIALIKVLTMS